jgi:hypothetical protein
MEEPFFNHMFPNEPWWGPRKEDFVARTARVDIFSLYEKYTSGEDDEEEICSDCGKERNYNEEEYTFEACICTKEKKTPTLQTILELLPGGVDPKDVSISMHFDSGDMGIYGHKLTFSYMKTFEDDPEGFEIAKKQFEKKLEIYETERKKYDIWKREQDTHTIKNQIKELEKKLADLKNSK